MNFIDNGATRDFAGGDTGCASDPEHDCYLWNHQITHCTPEYVSNECGMCGKITGFRWRKWSKRIRSLFTSNQDHYTVSKD
jgi:hypothetical protein